MSIPVEVKHHSDYVRRQPCCTVGDRPFSWTTTRFFAFQTSSMSCGMTTTFDGRCSAKFITFNHSCIFRTLNFLVRSFENGSSNQLSKWTVAPFKTRPWLKISNTIETLLWFQHSNKCHVHLFYNPSNPDLRLSRYNANKQLTKCEKQSLVETNTGGNNNKNTTSSALYGFDYRNRDCSLSSSTFVAMIDDGWGSATKRLTLTPRAVPSISGQETLVVVVR